MLSFNDTTTGGTGWKVGVMEGDDMVDDVVERDTDAVRPTERERNIEDNGLGDIVTADVSMPVGLVDRIASGLSHGDFVIEVDIIKLPIALLEGENRSV